MRLKRGFIYLILPLLLLGGCGRNETVPEVTGNFEFTVLKAGQADAIVLKTENHSVIIDCGEKDDGEKVAECLAENGISEVDCIFITHFDKDHVGGFPYVAENVTAKSIVTPNYEGSGSAYKKYTEAVAENGLAVTKLTEDVSFTLDDVLFEVSVPKRQTYEEEDNDFSLVISVTHGGNSFLFAGDAEKERLGEVISEFGKQYDFLKVPHHGKFNENTEKFIGTVKPAFAVICDSEKNPAEEETLAALASVGTQVYSTKDGNVNIISDGKKIKIVE